MVSVNQKPTLASLIKVIHVIQVIKDYCYPTVIPFNSTKFNTHILLVRYDQ